MLILSSFCPPFATCQMVKQQNGPSKSHPAALVLWHGGYTHVFYQQKNISQKLQRRPDPPKKKKEKEVCNIFSKSGYRIHFFKTKESTTSLPKPVAPRNSDQNDGPSEENTHHRDQSPNFLWSACKLLQVVVSPLQRKKCPCLLK